MGFFLACVMLFTFGCASKQQSKVTPVEDSALKTVSLDAVKAYEAGEKSRSLELYRALVEAEPKNHVYLNNMGVLLLESGQGEEALDAFEGASLLAPNNADYFVNIGFAQIKTGNLEESLTFFDRALQLAPRSGLALYGKGVAYLFLDESEIALGFFRRALLLDSANLEAVFMKAYASQKNSLWGDAVKEYTTYIGKSSDKYQRANAFSNRGLCYFQLGDFKRGMNDLDQAMLLNDANSTFYYNRAQGYQLQHKYEDAVKDYTRAISRKAEFPEAYINRGEMNYLIGKEAKGCSDLKRACDLGYCGPFEKYESAGKCAD